MAPENAPAGRLVPAVTVALALATLAAPFAPVLFPLVLVGAGSGACALALARRPSRPLRLAVLLVAGWLAAGLAAAWLLRGRPVAGLLSVLLVLFLIPLVLIPWLYARAFAGRDAGTDPGPRTPDPGREVGT
jgi:hypothetical protein